MSLKSVMPSSHLILCHPLLLLPLTPPSISVFSNKSTLLMRWPKYWSFGFIISPSNEHPGLISFRMDWLDLLAVQGTLKSLLQQQKKTRHLKEFSTFLCMGRYESEITEIIPLISISAIWGQYPVFSHLGSLWVHFLGWLQWLRAGWWASCF